VSAIDNTTSTSTSAPASRVPQTTSPAPSTNEVPEPTTRSVAVREAGPRTWDGADRLTNALVGGRGGFDRRGIRTDTIIVLSIDVATGHTSAFNVPRNWQFMTFPEGTVATERWPRGYSGFANKVYNLGLRFPDAFPDVADPGGQSIKSALAQLTGLPIRYYVLIDMQGVVKGIDQLGGLELYGTEWINDRIKPISTG
jgi:polyisoprenyl-teichoic acid--peptidoglycan teichoic acid transferase